MIASSSEARTCRFSEELWIKSQININDIVLFIKSGPKVFCFFFCFFLFFFLKKTLTAKFLFSFIAYLNGNVFGMNQFTLEGSATAEEMTPLHKHRRSWSTQ